jgi:2-polyprenyl-3-methyl-5-hydroxy-6-metoxy-1,4-benzoquinol methylase
MESRESDAEYWDSWNTRYRQPETIDEPSKRRMREVLEFLSRLKVREARILEVGSGTGWLSPKLAQFGAVTAVDLGEAVTRAAKLQMPEIDFRSGDVVELELPLLSFDVVVTLETLSHVRSQEIFIHRIARLLKPGGHLILTTQNKFVFDRRSGVIQNPTYIRKWVTMNTLKRLLRSEFSIVRATSLDPEGHLGALRIVNSAKVNRTLESVMGSARIKRLKEALGLGQTLFVVAVKR